MKRYTLEVTEDEALVLFEFFQRFDDTDELSFEHASEYIALLKIIGQIEKTSPAVFSENYEQLLAKARERIAEGFEGDVPGLTDKT
jgi:hypothetical protein